MKLTLYAGFAIAIVAYTTLAVTHTTSAVQALIALPGSAGLLIALWELIKANLEHQHRLDEKREENAFVLSAASHVAERAFDKHVEFCEKYLQVVRKVLIPLFQREGPTHKASDIARQLHEVRLDFELWEPKDVALELTRFEDTVWKIGADTHLILNSAPGGDLMGLMEKNYDTFRNVMTLDPLPDGPTPEIAVAHIVARLQDLLGVSELPALRKHLLSEVVKQIRPAPKSRPR
jgi:hypothetical protein